MPSLISWYLNVRVRRAPRSSPASLGTPRAVPRQLRRRSLKGRGDASRVSEGDAGAEVAIAACGKLDMEGHNMMQEQGAFGTDDPDEGRD